MERAVKRWVVDLSQWNSSNFSTVLALLPQHEHCHITRYRKIEDRKRALVSRLLQYALVNEVLGIPFDQIVIKRTAEGKPYLVVDTLRDKLPNFNYNVSHHGDFVAIASEPLCLVGLDVISYVLPARETIPNFVNSFSSYFSSVEWDKITAAGSSEDMLKELYRYWTLKEAFIKAIGSGVGYNLKTLEFAHDNWNNISLKLHGKEVTDWKFWHLELKDKLYVSIARGCPYMATESYKKALGQIDFVEDEYKLGFNLQNPSFTWKTVEDLIPVKSLCISA